ncbi:AAA family ATPase [Casimicrobium huifangae]|jgi:ABC-type branched-subunit amino acid transport system ATPase component|uniref:AAA family ATPase n=1 Tax=Casimicrobium huifangae TaxID=2591109 RepID=UPI0012EC1A0F|nr:ATP-binding protein [Casimicrobium huifangae]
MTDLSKKLAEQFAVKNRYANFGPCLRQLQVHGFRGIRGMSVDLEFPITAISGLNGAGKSTLGQLAICAYRKPMTSGSYKRHYIKDFFPVSPADPKPISDDAKSVYIFETRSGPTFQDSRISGNSDSK